MATLIEPLLPSVHDTLSLREALSKLSRKYIAPITMNINTHTIDQLYIHFLI
jgi:hypothetical protein